MNFAELLCQVAKLRFADEAQIGVRVSPIVISPEEALQIAEAARRLLPENTFVAVACPGVEPWEDERTCVCAGEHAAERATLWRNRVRGDQGDRILYVSARRLGRAGGLQDTLLDLSEQRLRAGFLDWCETADSGCPKVLADALKESGVADLADARALANYASAVFSAADPMKAAGLELPRLSLARDSNLASGAVARLRENVRWTRKAAAGDTRGVAKLSPAAAALQKALADALSNDISGDLAWALEAVDIGSLSLDELAGPQPKQRAPAKPKTPPKVAPVQPASKPARQPTTQPGPRHAPPAQDGASRPSAPTRYTEPSASHGEATPAGTPAPEPPSTPPRAPLPHRDEEQAAAANATSIGIDDDAYLDGRPPRPRPERRRAARAPSGPWSEAMHLEELGAPQRPPEGAMELLRRSLDAPLSALTWRTSGEDPNRVLVKLPRGLSDPQRAADIPTRLDGPYRAWDDARRELVVAAGGVDAVVDRFITIPYTAVGAPEVADKAVTMIAAARALLEAAVELGPDTLRWAMNLDTVSVCSVTGVTITVLTPAHPLYLAQVLQRVPQAADAASARDLARSLLARWIDRPLQSPSAWPYNDDVLIPAPLGRRILAFGSKNQGVSSDDIAALSAEIVRRHLAMNPATRLGLRVLVDAEQVDPVVAGIVRATLSDDDAAPARTWIHAPKPVTAADGLDALVASGRVVLFPQPLAGERPHVVIRVRHGAPSRPLEVEPITAWFSNMASVASATDVVPVETGTGAAQLAEMPSEPSADDSAWEVLIAPAIHGVARRGAHMLIREARLGAEVAVITRDLRGAARELQPILEQLGVGDVRPKVLRPLVTALASGANGVVALSSTPQRQLAALLLEHMLFETLGDEAIVASLTADDAPLWIGAPLDDWGAFSIAAAPRGGGLAVCIGYSAVAGMLPPEILATRLGQAASLLEAADDEVIGSYAARVVRELLSRGTGGNASELDSPADVATEFAFLCVLPPDHSWTSDQKARLDSRSVVVHVAGASLLERVMRSAGRPRN